MSKSARFVRNLRWISTTLKLVVSLVTLCCFACCSCTQQRITRSDSSHSRPFGTLTICSFHSSWACIHTPLVASSVTRRSRSLRSQATTSGRIVLVTKVGDGSSSEVESTSLSVCTVKFVLVVRPKLSRLSSILMVSKFLNY